MARHLLAAIAAILLLAALPLPALAQSAPTPVTTGELFAAGQQSAAAGDFVAAARWWQKGATLGGKDSARELGRLYGTGAQGVQQNLAWAREWLGRAAENGDPQAAAMLKQLDAQGAIARAAPPAALPPVAPPMTMTTPQAATQSTQAGLPPPRQVAVVNTLPPGAQAMPMIGAATGPTRTLVCGPNERMVGVNFRAGDWLDKVQIICAPYNGMTRGTPHVGPSAGGGGGTTDIEAFCGKWDPNAWVMSVGAVAIQNVTVDGAAPQTFVAKANLWCLTPKGSPVGVGPGNLQPKAQYEHSGKQNSSCPKDTPAVGLQVRGENHINAVGIICEGKAVNTALYAAHVEFDKGIAANKRGDYDTAIYMFTQVISFGPVSREDKASAHYNRSIAWEHKGDYSRAMADYNAAAAINPNVGPPPRAPQQTYSSSSGGSSGGGGKSMADQMMETNKRQRQERCTSWLNNPNRGKFASPC